MHEIAFGQKTTFPASTDVTYLRLGTAAMRVLAGRRQRLASRSNRPDTGHAGDADMSLHESRPSTTGRTVVRDLYTIGAIANHLW